MGWLAIIDVDSIHDYVFSPVELKLIRGSSNILDSFNLDIRNVYRKQCLLSGGGMAVGEFSNAEDARKFCRWAERRLLEVTQSATLSWAVSEEAPGTDSDKFPDDRKALLEALEDNKNHRRQGAITPASPYWLICESCGLNPASQLQTKGLPNDGGTSRWLCEACHLRSIRSGSVDFNMLAAESQPANYLAIAYLDLDRLGRWFSTHAGSKETYGILSNEVRKAVRQAAEAAAGALGKRGKKSEILLLGGDDLVAAFPASEMIPYVETLTRSLQEFRYPDGVPRPTFSLGVAIANSHFPIGEFRRIAEGLLRSAKTPRADQFEARAPKEDSIDFAVITASLSEDIPGERAVVRARQSGAGDLGAGEGLFATRRPYTMDEFAVLVANARAIRAARIPSTKVKQLYRMAHVGRWQAQYEYLVWLSRLTATDRLLMMGILGRFFWRENPNGSYFTEAADLVEIGEFLG